MVELKFTKRVLTKKASDRLKNKKITQTIRSDREMVGIGFARIVDVSLDDKKIGKVRISDVDKVVLSKLGLEDAKRGGFDNVEELREALRRAGYRYRPLSEYKANRVRFEWIEKRFEDIVRR